MLESTNGVVTKADYVSALSVHHIDNHAHRQRCALLEAVLHFAYIRRREPEATVRKQLRSI